MTRHGPRRRGRALGLMSDEVVYVSFDFYVAVCYNLNQSQI